MAKMMQIREMSDELHRRLKVRASHAGMTLQEYVLAELKAVAERPTPDEVLARLGDLPPVRVGVDEIVEAVRAGRVEPVEAEPAGPGEAVGEAQAAAGREGDAVAAAEAEPGSAEEATAAGGEAAETAGAESST